MAEIKTCEQYVLAKLENAENQVEELNNLIGSLKFKIEGLETEIEHFKELLDILGVQAGDCSTCDGAKIDACPVYSWDKDYARAKALYDSLMGVHDHPDHDDDKAPEFIDAEVVSK